MTLKGMDNFNKLESVLDNTGKALLQSGLFIKAKAQKKFRALPGLQVRTSRKTGKRYYHFKGKVPGDKPHIRSGRLRGSIVTAPKSPKDFITVGTNVKYAGAVEIGTSRQRPRPFLRTSALESKQMIIKIFKNLLGDKIKLVVK